MAKKLYKTPQEFARQTIEKLDFVDKATESDVNELEEQFKRAEAHGLGHEVMMTAINIGEDQPHLELIDVVELALQEWDV